MTMRDVDEALLALFVVVALFAMTFSTCTGEAQIAPPSDEEVLAALCVHEAGWDSPADCWGIFAVLANQAHARGVTWQSFARVHSPRFFAGVGRNPWAIALRDGERGPGGISWGNVRPATRETDGATCEGVRCYLPSRRDAFHALVVLAFEIARTPAVCGAMSWGSRADYASGTFAAQHAHDVFLDCTNGSGVARNLFSRGPT